MEVKKIQIILFLKGIAMGSADVIPGVSGGTIAFISGIYEELLTSISKLNLAALGVLKNQGVKSFWKHINGTFLATLFAGIFTAIILLSSLIKYLLTHHDILLWSFFFGLIMASVYLVGKQVKKWNTTNIIALVISSICAYYITLATPTQGSENLIYIFFCGVIAITAMILPGISGSFILLLMGTYFTVLNSISSLLSSVKDGDSSLLISSLVLLGVFAAGCIIGLLSFSKLLSWLFKKAHDLTVAILTGFLIGSLNKVWPWKEVLQTITKHAGEAKEEIVPIVQQNISPWAYQELTSNAHQLLFAIVLALLGIAIIVVLDKFSPEKS
jgi:putative membrane protein